MWKYIVVLFACSCWASPSFATGGFSCEIDDKNLQFETSSALGTGMGAPILNLKAHAKLKIRGTPNDLQDLDLRTNLVHSWINHPDFRVHFYLEREGETPHGTFELVLMTIASDDEGTYDGDYRLTIFYTEPPANQVEGAYLKATGKVKCFVE